MRSFTVCLSGRQVKNNCTCGHQILIHMMTLRHRGLGLILVQESKVKVTRIESI